MEQDRQNALDSRRCESIVSNIKTWCNCMLLHLLEVCTHLYMMQAGSCRKCELRNWVMLPGDNFWADSAMGDSGSLEMSYRGLSCEECKSCVLTTPWWSYPS